MAQPHITAAEESDFSLRKIKIAFAVLLGTMFGSSILPMMAIGLLLIPMTQEFGWSATAFSGGLTAMMLAGACAAPVLGRLVDRMGVRPMIIGGTVLVALVVAAMSLQDGSLFQFYASFAALGVAGTTAIGYSKVIGALFTKHRGKALAIFGIESSIAMSIAPFVIMWLIEAFGWRGMFVGLGIIILAAVPILLLWLEEPAAPGAMAGGAHVSPEALPGLTISEVLRTRTFWFMAIAALLAIGPGFGLLPHFIPYLIGRGFGPDSAVGALPAMTFGMAAGTLIGGWLVDWAKGAWIAAPFSAMIAVALGCFTIMSSTVGGIPLLMLAMALLGIANGAVRPMGTYFQLRFFGLKSFGTVIGVQSPFLAVGMGIAPLAVGWCFDTYRSYEPAFLVMTIAMVVATLLYLGLGPYRFSKELAEGAPPAPDAELPHDALEPLATRA